MNKKLLKYLEARKSKIVDDLTELRSELEKSDEERGAVEDIEKKVTELEAELNDVKEQLKALQEDPEADKEEIDAADEERDAEENESGEKEKDEEKRSAIANAITRSMEATNVKKDKKQQIRSGFVQFLAGRINEAEARSLGVAFNNGGVLVPEELSNEIISYAQEENPLRKYGSVHRTKGTLGFPVLIKTFDANIVKTERDTNAIPETDIKFDEVFLSPIEIDAITTVTNKITLQAEYDIEQIIMEELKKAYVRKEVQWMIHDTANPGSLATKLAPYAPMQADGVTPVTDQYDKLVSLKNAVPTAVRGKAKWYMNRAAQTMLETLKDTSGQPLLKEFANDDFEFKLLGYPVVVSDHFDGANPGTPFIVFGDMKAFHIQDVQNAITLQPLRELYAAVNKIGYKLYNVVDGQLVYGPLEVPLYRLA
ncbi:phage major capsid protein [Macrococcoides bohemicum]|uniref:Phage major capsid protein n=1 Tax=Macrococcoides bohemicum TaxID=1903056 RepID=A0A328A7D5_9STAP|nr:phage major capsid protein [Macrococcus bohemicus]RAK50196.1 phage major capsid protein [Macrococcus bohemicus]